MKKEEWNKEIRWKLVGVGLHYLHIDREIGAHQCFLIVIIWLLVQVRFQGVCSQEYKQTKQKKVKAYCLWLWQLARH